MSFHQIFRIFHLCPKRHYPKTSLFSIRPKPICIKEGHPLSGRPCQCRLSVRGPRGHQQWRLEPWIWNRASFTWWVWRSLDIQNIFLPLPHDVQFQSTYVYFDSIFLALRVWYVLQPFGNICPLHGWYSLLPQHTPYSSLKVSANISWTVRWPKRSESGVVVKGEPRRPHSELWTWLIGPVPMRENTHNVSTSEHFMSFASSGKKNKIGNFLVVVQLIHRLTQAETSAVQQRLACSFFHCLVICEQSGEHSIFTHASNPSYPSDVRGFKSWVRKEEEMLFAAAFFLFLAEKIKEAGRERLGVRSHLWTSGGPVQRNHFFYPNSRFWHNFSLMMWHRRVQQIELSLSLEGLVTGLVIICVSIAPVCPVQVVAM